MLSETLALAERAGRQAGVTRLADVSGLTPFRVPVFQAIRPWSRSLSVSQGKGLTPMAARISALLEAAELAVAERLPSREDRCPLTALPPEEQVCWSGASRRAGAIRLDQARPREWVPGTCLLSGRGLLVPLDLIALDYTVASETDACASSSGLATGNTVTEATTSAVAELLERDLAAAFDGASRRTRHELEIDPNSVTDPVIRILLRRIAHAGYSVRFWSLGQSVGIAALRCAIVARGRCELPATIGSGCHPSRRVATVRALLEAVQVHATLVAGARDDLDPEDYADPTGQTRDLLFNTLSLAAGGGPWARVPDASFADPAQSLDRVLAVAAERSPLPVIGVEHDCGVAGLHVVRVVAPGLVDPVRAATVAPFTPVPRLTPAVRSRPRSVLFVGPTLSPDEIPPDFDRRPPAVAGDLAALLAAPPGAVGLIDGCFTIAPSVWHKEILHLLAAGIPVAGAASLGAIRAAEMQNAGMIGVGAIYAAYRDGFIERDDAVMLTHAPAELRFRSLTVALIDAEAAISTIPMSVADRRQLLRIARTTHYAERTWDHCLDLFEKASGRPAPVTAAALAARPSLKRSDALALIDALPAIAAMPIHPREMPLLTAPYRRLLARTMPAPR